jgi:formate hydrogenlyase transcriptional activator
LEESLVAEHLLGSEQSYSTLLEINNAIVSNLTEEGLFRPVCAVMRQVVPHDQSGIFLFDEDKRVLRLLAIESSVNSKTFEVGAEVDSEQSHVGWPFHHRRPLLRSDLKTQREFDSEDKLFSEGFRSMVCVPLLLKGQSIGAYCVSSLQANQFSEAEADFLMQVAGQIALAAENMRAYQHINALLNQVQQTAERSTALLEINNAVIGKLTQEEFFSATCQALRRIVPYDRASLTLFEPSKQKLRFVAIDGGIPSDYIRVGYAVGLDDSHHGWVFKNQRPLLRYDLEKEREFAAEDRAYAAGGRSFCAVPLIVNGESIGVINVLSFKKNQYSRTDAEFLRDTANRVALAIKSHQDVATAQAKLEAENVYLQEEKDRLRLAIDTIPALVVVCEPDGTAEMLSQRWLDYTGLPQEQVQGWGWRITIHPEDRDDLESHWRSVVASREPGQRQARMRRFDGEYRWFQFRGTPLLDDQGNVLKWYGTSTDIHDLKLAEASLRRSEAYLAEAQRLSLTGSFGWSIPNGEIVWSEETFRIIGLNPTTKPTLEAIIQRTHPEDRARVQGSLDRASLELTELDFEHRLLMPNGTVKYVRVVGRPYKQPSGQVEIVGAVTDVTTTKLALQEIQKLRDQLHEENLVLREEVDRASMFDEIVGTSQQIQAVTERVSKVARTDSTVLITGETGTGKELFARAVHKKSQRFAHAFVTVNCGAISAGLVESELFGHIKGAFTGAIANRDGRFKVADGGTILLDEVGDLPLETQVKLLRVLQEHEFEPIGSDKKVRVDVRVIAATNRNLDEAVRSGRFRSDLLYRLNVFPIHLPPLRERPADIPLLVTFLLQMFSRKLGKSVVRVPDATMQRLIEYSWPGNIRELQNIIERCVILSNSDSLLLDQDFLLPSSASAEQPPPSGSSSSVATLSLQEAERRHIKSVLVRTNWAIEGEKGAARILNLNPSTLRSRMKKLGIHKPDRTIT